MRDRSLFAARSMAMIILASVLAGCTHTVERRLAAPTEVETLDERSPYLKAHLPDGRVYVLSQWRADSAGSAILGDGSLLDAHRMAVESGAFRVPVDSVALFETNVRHSSGATTSLTVMAGITAAVAGYCVTNPKACFGSCPTFYAPGPDGSLTLQAEGFSASIAPALEATDIDMLSQARAADRDFTIRVTNEAFETHVIRHADLLALPGPPGSRVYVTSEGVFREAAAAAPPARCTGAEGDCLDALGAIDGVERASRADSSDLATKETIELVFDRVPDGDLGLVVASRQTLMTTFLIYQALAYMGNDASRWLATLGAGSAARERAGGIGRALGAIDVLVVSPEGDWVTVGRSGETGPIASDTRVVPLGVRRDEPRPGAPLRIRLRLTQGLWRLDGVLLVALGDSVEPIRVRPREVTRQGRPDTAALHALLDPETTLVTLPGDAYDIRYRLPQAPASHELFLEARGYYLEWMREEWLAEENPLLAARLVLDPTTALRDLAPIFKAMEPEMEDLFWRSRYVR